MIGLSKITLTFGGPPLFDELDLQVAAGDRLCLLGRNGTGKSTLLKVLAGQQKPDKGEVARINGLTMAFLGQEIPENIDGTVFSVAAEGLGEKKTILEEYHILAENLDSDPSPAQMKKLEELQQDLDRLQAWDADREVSEILSHLDLDPHALFQSLSGGTKRRVLLARALVAAPDLLLLDEPTNHLDIPRIIWLENYLLSRDLTLVFITHDRSFARRLANKVAELDRGKIYAYDCSFDQFFVRREEVLEAEAKAEKNAAKKLAQEEAWVRRGVKARLKRDEGRVKRLLGLRAAWAEKRSRVGQVKIGISTGGRSGDLVAGVEGLSFGYGDRPLVKDFSTVIQRGDKIGLIGPNGSGKTTLIRLLLGDIKPLSGKVQLGTELQVVYFDQMRQALDPAKSLAENLGDGYDTVEVNGKSKHVLAYLGDFLFPPERANVPVGVLSGGEKNRLLLAKLFARPSNLLILDEPTNDLDAETLDLLEELLVDYQGTLILVSHDRDFLNQVVTSTLVLEGEGRVGEYPGGYDDWLGEKARLEARKAEEVANRSKPGIPTEVKNPKDSPKPTKLSFKEQKEKDELPGKISTLEAAIAERQAKLADPAFYKSSAMEVTAVSAKLKSLETELEAVYSRWMELEEK